MGIFAENVPWMVDLNLLGESMLAIFTLDLLVFKPIMFSLAFDGSNGLFPWEGSSILLHLIVSSIVAALGFLTIYLGFRKVVQKAGRMYMPKQGRVHRVVGAFFIFLWLTTYVIGLYIFIKIWY
jgi:uncharacterized membrane protein YozB (DUF420 family)